MLKLLPRELLNLHRAPTRGEAAGPVAGTQGAVGKPQPCPCHHRSRRSPRKTAVCPQLGEYMAGGVIAHGGLQAGALQSTVLNTAQPHFCPSPKRGVAAGVNSAVLRSHWAHQAGVWTLACACLPPPPARAAG